MSFKIGENKIYWPEAQYFEIQLQFGLGTGWYYNDLLDIAERAGLLFVPEESVHYNELLAGELGIDLLDVWDAIRAKVDREHTWASFAEYKQLLHDTLLTFDEFVEVFQIAIYQE